MADDFADELAREVPDWVEEGLVSEDQADDILDRYGTEAAPGAGGLVEDLASDGFEPALYGTAAVLAGAAAIAFVLVGLDPPDPGVPLAGLGLVMAGLGAAVHVAAPEADRVADVLLAASLVPMAAAAFPVADEAWLPRIPGILAPVVLLSVRHERSWVRTLSVVAFPFAVAGAAFSQFAEPEPAAWFFLALQSLLLASLVARDRLVEGRDHPATVGLGVAGLAVAVGFFLEIVVDVGGSEQLELALGAAMIALILAGLAIAHRGIVAGAGLVLAGDAVVFAFDVGGTFGGTLLLLGLAVFLVWQAEAIRGAVG